MAFDEEQTMTMSKVKSFLASMDRKDAPPKKANEFVASADTQAASAEQLMRQLCDIIMGPQAKMTESRFLETLNILEEQKKTTERRMDKVDRHLAEAADKATIMTLNIEGHDEDIRAIRQRIDSELQVMRDEQKSVMAEMRQGLDLRSRTFFDELTKRSQEFEMIIRSEVAKLSNALAVHVAEEDKRWAEERQTSAEILDQMITELRSERENNRRHDMEQLAGSMMDMGRRLMGGQQHA
jgi:hypothetical protein